MIKTKFYSMKKMIAVMGIVLVSTCFVSCKKDAPPVVEDPIVRTDDPPKEMFPESEYALTTETYIEEEDIKSIIKKGRACFWDNYSNTLRDCGDWYLLSAKKYWGIYQGKVYISKSKDWYVIQAEKVLNAQAAVQNKGAAIGQTCNSCEHPFTNYGWISWVQQ